MTDGPAPSVWEALRLQRPIATDALATSPVEVAGQETSILYGMSRSGDLHLVIPVSTGPTGTKPPDLKGLKVRHRQIGAEQCLVVEALACHERIFSPLCAEIITAILQQHRNPWDAVAAILRAWQSAWRPATPAMDKTTQVGLYGELFVMERIMVPVLGPAAVGRWSGPDWERHDFVHHSLHLEVKTTRKSVHQHEISRHDQLRVPVGRSLIVVSILVEESVAGAESLADPIDRLVEQLRTSPADCDEFLAKLSEVGWADEMRSSGELLRFHLRDARGYQVDDAFPRLPDEFELPDGVVAVRYTVDLVNLPSIGLTEMHESVRSQLEPPR